jgi:hypothetical protein
MGVFAGRGGEKKKKMKNEAAPAAAAGERSVGSFVYFRCMGWRVTRRGLARMIHSNEITPGRVNRSGVDGVSGCVVKSENSLRYVNCDFYSGISTSI